MFLEHSSGTVVQSLTFMILRPLKIVGQFCRITFSLDLTNIGLSDSGYASDRNIIEMMLCLLASYHVLQDFMLFCQ